MLRFSAVSMILLGSGLAQAHAQQAAAPSSPSAFSVSANLSVASQYRYRGIMQTNNRPAIQGGFDIEHESGFYLGNWNSSISWLSDSDPDVSSAVEMDFYGGYKFPLGEQFSVDLGAIHYRYPGSYPDGYTKPHTTELYLGLGYGPVTFKYSHAVTNLFGVADSRNSQYYDLSGSFETGFWGLTLDAHVGYQKVRNLEDGSYTDWSLGVTKDWGAGFSTSIAYVDTNADRDLYTNSRGKYMGRSAVVLNLSKAF